MPHDAKDFTQTFIVTGVALRQWIHHNPQEMAPVQYQSVIHSMQKHLESLQEPHS